MFYERLPFGGAAPRTVCLNFKAACQYLIRTTPLWNRLLYTHSMYNNCESHRKGGVLQPIRIIIPANCTSSTSKLLLIRFSHSAWLDARASPN
jgi:hypothetical protein